MEKPRFIVDDVKYVEDPVLFSRAETLFKNGKVMHVVEVVGGYSAKVQGTNLYEVWITNRHVDRGGCTCYMGQNDMLCKHMLALALTILDKTGGLATKAPPTDLKEAKQKVSEGMRKLGPYNGPSRIWFSYQRKLATGAGMITEAVSGLAPTKEHADFIWKLVLRISKKLATSGIDDSDGVVGSCVYELVVQLGEYAKTAPELKPVILQYCNDDTGFGFEDELRHLLK